MQFRNPPEIAKQRYAFFICLIKWRTIMGYTHYSVNDRRQRAEAAGFATRSRDEIFANKNHIYPRIHGSTQSFIKESRDSATHPNSIPIIIALDVTGSMGQIPHSLVIDGLPTLMSTIIQHGFLIHKFYLWQLAIKNVTVSHYRLANLNLVMLS